MIQRSNTIADAMTTGEAELDVGGGLRARIPLGKQRYTVDESAGRVVKVWDYLNARDQVIYGDTGWRDVSALLINGWTGSVHIRRCGLTIWLRVQNLSGAGASGSPFMAAITGFGAGFAGYMAGASSTTLLPLEINGSLQFALPTTTVTSAVRWALFSFPTTSPWPTSLPGTASGTIPL